MQDVAFKNINFFIFWKWKLCKGNPKAVPDVKPIETIWLRFDSIFPYSLTIAILQDNASHPICQSVKYRVRNLCRASARLQISSLSFALCQIVLPALFYWIAIVFWDHSCLQQLQFDDWSVCVPLYITKSSEAVLQCGKRKNIKNWWLMVSLW